MNERFRRHIDELFKNAPNTRQASDIKEEILQNTIDRYNDLIAEGRSEEDAYAAAIAGIGDVKSIINSITASAEAPQYTREEIDKNRRLRSLLLTVAVMLYICSVILPIIADAFNLNDELGAAFVFVLIAIATGLIIYRSGLKLRYDENDRSAQKSFGSQPHVDKNRELKKSVSAAVWAVAVVIYLAISFISHSWHITWLVFPIALAVQNIIFAALDITK